MYIYFNPENNVSAIDLVFRLISMQPLLGSWLVFEINGANIHIDLPNLTLN